MFKTIELKFKSTEPTFKSFEHKLLLGRKTFI